MFRNGRTHPQEELQRRQRDRAEALARRSSLAEQLRRTEPANEIARSWLTVAPALLLGFGGDVREVPLLVRTLLSATLNPEPMPPLCIVLPDPGDIAGLLAILGSLEVLPRDFEAQQHDFIRRELLPGRRVRSLAEGNVYGVGEPSGEDAIWFHYLDARNERSNGRFRVPRSDLFGFEPTDRKRPMGKPGPRPALPPTTSFDRACQVKTFGNSSLIRNRIILLGGKASFRELVNRTSVAALHDGGGGRLSDDFVWGIVSETGGLVPEHPRDRMLGEPLVAVTRNPILIREICASRSSEKASRTVICDSMDLALKHLDLMKRIGERQRLVLLTSSRRREEAQELKRGGWIVWEPQPWEVSEAFDADAGMTDAVGRSIRSLRSELQASLTFKTAASDAIAAAQESVREVSRLLCLEENEFDDELQGIDASLRTAFHSAADWTLPPGEAAASRFESCMAEVRGGVDLVRRRAGGEARASVEAALASLDEHRRIVASRGASAKAEALLDLLATGDYGTVVTGHSRSSEEIGRFVHEHEPRVKCITAGEMDAEPAVDGLIVTSAFGAFDQIVDPWPATRVAFAGYEFETRAYRWRLFGRERARAALALNAEERTRLVGMPRSMFGSRPEGTLAPAAPKDDLDTSAMFDTFMRPRRRDWSRRPEQVGRTAGEGTLPARFCRFVGRSWAAFTEEHRPIVLFGDETGEAIVRRVDLSDLRPGLQLIMREAGEKDAIRLLAEEACGAARYADLRSEAELWRTVLHSGGSDVDAVSDSLEAVGLRRNPATIRSWMRNPDVIGPRHRDDLHRIAEAFAPGKFAQGKWDLCWNAIRDLRDAHVAAGARLSRILASECRGRRFDHSEHEIPVHLALGTVWVLEIGHLDDRLDEWPSGTINRLQWDQVSWKERLLGAGTELRAA